ncbi:hypothetical protein BC827DRAFT_1225626 [Russula dissimulans]|nr:hypothetical protein BC827DRAFT_1225626 [Russula dissimulans]
MVTWPGNKEPGQQRLASRNPPPVQQYGEEMGRLGLEEAWEKQKVVEYKISILELRLLFSFVLFVDIGTLSRRTAIWGFWPRSEDGVCMWHSMHACTPATPTPYIEGAFASPNSTIHAITAAK